MGAVNAGGTSPKITLARMPSHGCLGAAIWSKDPCLYSFKRRNRKALPTTLTDDSAMAAAAIIGDNRIPKNG